ncbi:MAG: copper resistance system multicopper oxidase [Gammaproteobacteria bacterium]|nr:copper resistance system multicopper oxidase [Gammaproteobacteria bacterium]
MIQIHSHHRVIARFAWQATLPVMLMTGLFVCVACHARDYQLDISQKTIKLLGDTQTAIVANNSFPGPVLHWHEGETVTIRVNNHLDEPTSIHWHGILLPYTMDGVPGTSFDGIDPGQSFTYQFKVNQHGTYWYHGHSALQEQLGLFGALIIDPAQPDAARMKSYTIVLSDWPEADPYRTLARLKKQSDYYNYQKRTIFDFFDDIESQGFSQALNERLMWGKMRMDPTDLTDVTGATYHFLINGHTAQQNWTALFEPGETVRLRVINASAMTFFDVRIPGLTMQVVEADGVAVKPVRVSEFRVAVAETYDVIVQPQAEQAYTLFAEAMDRSGFARATLTPSPDLSAPIPELRPIELLTMADMGTAHNDTHSKHASDGRKALPKDQVQHQHRQHPMQNTPGHDTAHTADHKSVRTLDYRHLEPLEPAPEWKPVDREITLRLTGNMNRYIWSFNDTKYSDAEPIRVRLGDHIRFTYINETMMNHPIHLHGLWQYLDIGRGNLNPKKHVINVKPGQTVKVDVIADAPGIWAFHCHLLYHMGTGMFRQLIVES